MLCIIDACIGLLNTGALHEGQMVSSSLVAALTFSSFAPILNGVSPIASIITPVSASITY